MQDNQFNQLNYDATEIKKVRERFYTSLYPNGICLGTPGGGRCFSAREEIAALKKKDALKSDQKDLD